MGSPNCKDLKMLWGNLIFEVPDSHLFWGVWGAWMTFKKPEMDKTLRNGLFMSEMVGFCDLVGTVIAPV